MKHRDDIESILQNFEMNDFKWLNPKKIPVAHWVRNKCIFGCPDYGLGACPPNTPAVEDCKKLIHEYKYSLIIRLTTNADKNKYPSDWSDEMADKLLQVERSIFLLGFPKAFLLNQTCCVLCSDCPGDRFTCKDKKHSRPSPESFAIDVYKTAQRAGLDIHVITENPSEINRIAILLID